MVIDGKINLTITLKFSQFNLLRNVHRLLNREMLIQIISKKMLIKIGNEIGLTNTLRKN